MCLRRRRPLARRAPGIGVWRRLPQDARGVAAVEFAILVTLLMMILMGIVQFGIAINNYMTLTNAAEAGAQTLSQGRGTSTPYTAASNAMQAAAGGMWSAITGASLMHMYVNGTECTTDTACSTALAGTANQNESASVTLSYPCSIIILGHNYAAGTNCISTQSSFSVQ